MATLSNKMSHTKLSLRWFLAAGAAIVALGLPQYSRGADQVEVKGDCNAVAQDERVDKASVKIVNIYCNKGNGLGINSFRVRYIWIDALDASFLLAGYSDEVLVKTIGNSPRVLKNLVYDEMAEIINSFGDRPQTIDHTTTVKSGKDELSSFSSALIPSAVLRKIKVYAATDPLPWPDLEASLHIRDDESTWPDNYKLSYNPNSNDVADIRKYSTKYKIKSTRPVFSCVLLYNFVSSMEFTNYWQNIDALVSAIQAEKMPPALIDNGSGDVQDDAVGNPTYDAIEYFTQRNFPDDFLLKVGSFSDVVSCGDDPSDANGFLAYPRQPYFLIAVIEATGPSLKLDSVDYTVDNSKELRKESHETIDATQNLNSIQLLHGEVVVIPLRIELSYGEDHGGLDYMDIPQGIERNPGSEAVYRTIKKLKSNKFDFYDANDDILFRKLKSAYTSPVFTHITPSYVFGASLKLKSLVVAGQRFSLRPPPTASLFAVAGGEEGSCPFLFVSGIDFHQVALGRVLIGAWDAAKTSNQEILLPVGTNSIQIAEREPEVTYLDLVSISDGGAAIVLAKNIQIGPGRGITMRLPHPTAAGAKLFVRGYFQRVPSLAVN